MLFLSVHSVHLVKTYGPVEDMEIYVKKYASMVFRHDRIKGPPIASLTTKAHGLLHSGDSGPGVRVR